MAGPGAVSPATGPGVEAIGDSGRDGESLDPRDSSNLLGGVMARPAATVLPGIPRVLAAPTPGRCRRKECLGPDASVSGEASPASLSPSSSPPSSLRTLTSSKSSATASSLAMTVAALLLALARVPGPTRRGGGLAASTPVPSCVANRELCLGVLCRVEPALPNCTRAATDTAPSSPSSPSSESGAMPSSAALRPASSSSSSPSPSHCRLRAARKLFMVRGESPDLRGSG